MADQSIDTKFATDPVVPPVGTDRIMVTQSGTTRVETRAQSYTLKADESNTGLDAAGVAILGEAATATNPTICPHKADLDTGVGWSAADQLSLIAGGLEMLRLVETGTPTTDQVIIGPAGVIGSAATPSLAWGDGNTGFYENSDNVLIASAGGTIVYVIEGDGLRSGVTFSWELQRVAGSATDPVLAFSGDEDTGVGRAAADALSFIAGAIEGIRLTEISDHVIQTHEAQVGITANSNSSQGDTPLLSTYNVISVVVSAGHAVTLPAVFGLGTTIFVKNDDAAESMDIFPASGDDAGAGTDTAVALAAGVGTLFVATVANATWTQMF